MGISFIGGGVMAEALIRGIIKADIAQPNEVIVSEPVSGRRDFLEAEMGGRTVEQNGSILDAEGLIVLAVKPQTLPYVFPDLSGNIENTRGVASIIAGASSQTIKDGLSHKPVIRIMPNTPAQIGQGMSVWTATTQVSEGDKKIVGRILKTLGDECYVDDEKYIDMATALGASGPAYVFLFIEAMIDSGVYLGMSRDMARRLVLQTVLGSTELVKQSAKHPAELKDMVTSPAGTTIEALVSMEKDGFRAAIINGIRAAYDRSVELGG